MQRPPHSQLHCTHSKGNFEEGLKGKLRMYLEISLDLEEEKELVMQLGW
jgi:hypothetical protein